MAHETPLGRIFFDLYNCTIGKLYVGMLDTIICSSDYEANAFKRDLSPRCPVVIVPHGVRDVIQSPSRKRLGEKVRLLYVGYILNIKGVHNLLELTRYLVEENIFSEVRLTIIGKVLDENYHAKMEKYAKDHGLSDLIEWRDAVSPDRLPQEYRSHDLFLLLSLGENFGIVAAEALAEGTPCVVSNNTALSEFAMEPGCFKLDVPLDLDQVNALFRELKSSEIVVGPFKKKVLRWDVVMERYLSLY
jgi:glycosyltransferase involved in cell wall biosynthesis